MILILAIAVYMDFKCYRISNKLVIAGICIGSLHNFLQLGIYGLVCSILWGIIPIAILFILYIISALGAGDIKLFAVIGIFGGISFCFKAIIIAFIIGAIISLVKMVRHGILFERLRYFSGYILSVIQRKKLLSYDIDKKEKYVIHFSFPIILSVVILCICGYI
jgi:prepilin peptidase CpaA